MKPTQEQVIAWAREAGLERIVGVYADGSRMVEVPNLDLLERFATLAYEAGRKDENEAFEKELLKEDQEWLDDEAFLIVTELLKWVRARRKQ